MSELTNGAVWMCVTTLAYFLLNGAQIYETFVVVPRWTAAPPESLHYFKGKYALDLKTFWMAIHALHEMTFILAIIFCWKLPIRNMLVSLFMVHFAVRAWTIVYFAPKIFAFQSVANEEKTMNHMPQLALRWRQMNYIRVAVCIAISLALIPLCLKAATVTINQ
jgi:hypothetical protein